MVTCSTSVAAGAERQAVTLALRADRQDAARRVHRRARRRDVAEQARVGAVPAVADDHGSRPSRAAIRRWYPPGAGALPEFAKRRGGGRNEDRAVAQRLVVRAARSNAALAMARNSSGDGASGLGMHLRVAAKFVYTIWRARAVLVIRKDERSEHLGSRDRRPRARLSRSGRGRARPEIWQPSSS